MSLSFRSIELSDKQLLDTLLLSTPKHIPESSFAYMYLWRNNFDLKIASGDGWVVIRIDVGDHYTYKPICLPDRYPVALDLMEQYAHELGQKVQLEFLEELECSRIFEVKPHWVQSTQDLFCDYVYDLSQMYAMQGSGFSLMRKLVSRFLRDCPNYSFDLMTDDDNDECMGVLEEWCRTKDEQGKDYSMTEVELNREALRLRKELDLMGFVLRIEGKVIGYLIDHIPPAANIVIGVCEKAILVSPGVIKMMEYLNCGYLMEAHTYINVGDDGGCERLKAAKEAMNPIRRIYKYTIIEP